MCDLFNEQQMRRHKEYSGIIFTVIKDKQHARLFNIKCMQHPSWGATRCHRIQLDMCGLGLVLSLQSQPLHLSNSDNNTYSVLEGRLNEMMNKHVSGTGSSI